MDRKKIRVSLPGTCGEMIQSVYAEGECLISLPVDMYTTWTIGSSAEMSDGVPINGLMEKSRLAVELAIEHCGHRIKDHDLYFHRETQLDTGKGMASSTADIAALISGVCAYFDVFLSEEDILRLCVKIEPSDGIMLSGWALIDHLKGSVLERYENPLNFSMLMLTPKAFYKTENLRRKSDYAQLLATKTTAPIDAFRRAQASCDLKAIGWACSLSLFENEAILKKMYLADLIEYAYRFGCVGIAGGHSGTVAGLIIDPVRTDVEALRHELGSSRVSRHYTRIQQISSVSGGVRFY